MVRRLFLLGVVALGLFSAPLFAQSASPQDPPPLATLSLIRTLSQRLDLLQARTDNSADDPIASYADVNGVNDAHDPSSPTMVMVIGWAVACNQDAARVAIVVDDIELASVPGRGPRSDVAAGFEGSGCQPEAAPGVYALVDLAQFEPGFQNDHTHQIKIRVYNRRNQMIDSRPKPFTVLPRD